MTESLFRAEVLASRGNRQFGTLLLRQTGYTRALTALIALAFLVLLSLSFTLELARRETLHGTLQPTGGLWNASSDRAGSVVEVHVHQGQSVQANQLLCVVSGDRLGVQGQTGYRVEAALDEQVALMSREIEHVTQRSQIQREALEKRHSDLDTQVEHIDAEIRLQAMRLGIAERAHRRSVVMAREGVVGQDHVDDKSADVLMQRAQLLELRRNRLTLTAERDNASAELRQIPLTSLREVAELQGRLAALQSARAENDSLWRWEIRAGAPGKVTLVSVQPGTFVKAGDVLVSVAPEGSTLEIVLEAHARAAAQLRIGMPVRVSFDALPYQTYGFFSATLYEVSNSPSPTGAAPRPMGDPEWDQSPTYRARAHLGPDRLSQNTLAALQPGMPLQATVTLESRKLFQWVLEPLAGMKDRML